MRWLAAVAAVVAILVGALVWLGLRDGPPPAEPGLGSAVANPDRRTGDGVAIPIQVDADTGVANQLPDELPDAAMTEFKLRSDPFWDRVDDYPRQRLLGFIADCYTGGEARKAKLKLAYQLTIRDHTVRLENIRVVETTLVNKTVEQCMIKTLQDVAFEDQQMPDWVSPDDDPETILIRVENLKRFVPEQKDGMK
jgi:hypothetical protein